MKAAEATKISIMNMRKEDVDSLNKVKALISSAANNGEFKIVLPQNELSDLCYSWLSQMSYTVFATTDNSHNQIYKISWRTI